MPIDGLLGLFGLVILPFVIVGSALAMTAIDLRHKGFSSRRILTNRVVLAELAIGLLLVLGLLLGMSPSHTAPTQ